MTPSKNSRAEIEELLEQGEYASAQVRLGDMWRREGKASTASYILSCYERLQGNFSALPCRISVLRSMTVEPLIPMLRTAALVSGINPVVQVGEFNAYAQEILDPASSLYSFNPDLAILAVQTRDILPEIWDAYADLSVGQVDAAIERVRESFSGLVSAFRRRSKASLIIHTLEKPAAASFGILDSQGKNGQSLAIERVNQELRAICNEHRGVYALDYEALVARHGRLRWHDETKWLTVRMPFATESLFPMVTEWLKFIFPLTGVMCKVLAIDLDNTLWGGILGEDGPEALLLSSEYPGAFYRGLQRAILDLYQRGILLAVCSKNNHEEALAILSEHPEMLLRPQHFAAMRINWQDKAQNLREIASELNVGIDSIAFLDDNPVERDLVRTEVPEVKVIALPDHSQGYAEALRQCPFFERLTLSGQDRERTLLYQQQQHRAQLAQSTGSLEDFYRSLDQEVIITPVTPATIARAAQLTQKTNQFNVTTRRFSEQQIEELTSRPDLGIYSVRVKDRFGDNGIVGLLITRMNEEVCEIDTFLLSCRVIGRTIETALLGFLTEAGKAGGAKYLQGWYLPTKKNAPVRELYPSHQFRQIASQDGATLWSLDLEEAGIACPDWIRLCTPGILPSAGRSEERAHA
jgi:FkbH-like protein